MGKIEVPESVLSLVEKSDSITEERLITIWAITLWYNGVGIQHGSNLYHISTSKPPTLQALLDCSDKEWETIFKPELEFLLQGGAVTEKTILRRNVTWAPTDTFLKLSAGFFADYLEQIVVPHSAFNMNKGHIGDPLESLPHRTAVEQALSWLNAAGYQWALYPGQTGHPRADVHGKGPIHPSLHDTMMDSEIEVISNHNNKEMYVKKYAMFAERSGNSTWIFENRKVATKIINHLSETNISNWVDDEYLPCDIDNAPLSNPENYAIKTLNRYLKQSRENPQLACPGMDHIQTITGIYESRHDESIRRPVTIWNTNTNEIELLMPDYRTTSITLEELNAGAKLRLTSSSA
ncbi:hypothetical protein LPA44_16115 [Halobacterium sp. KA-4]|uniref:hypothetical protein n=1 Tax=Halobacterium sp. KA-4 TaxID=2896367 RepID=UPI001E3B1D06|nr:hypothetical protein [Halobacterium sp. KA-4]MCD2201396.1 hypothetical protein [Halobacterium sp. KA-4]